MQKLVCVRPLNEVGGVDASGMAMRVHAEKAVSAEEEQQWQVLMESVGRKSGRLERTSASKGHRGENVEKCRIPGARTAVKRGENVEKCRIPGVSRRNEREDGHGRMTEHEGGEQKQKKQQQKKKKTKKKNKNIMMMMMMMMMMIMMMMMTMTMIAETMMM